MRREDEDCKSANISHLREEGLTGRNNVLAREQVVGAGELGSLNKIKLSQGWVRLSKESSQGPKFWVGLHDEQRQRNARPGLRQQGRSQREKKSHLSGLEMKS